MNDTNSVRQLWDGWRPPAELERSRPRPVRFTVRGKFILFLMVTMVGGGLIVGMVLYRRSAAEGREDRLLAVAGSESEARITRLWQTSGKNRRCFATYQFQATEALVSTSAVVNCRAWKELSEDQRLKVRYIAGNPAVNRLEGVSRGERTPFWFAPALVVGLTLLALLIARRVAIERRLLEDGHAAPGAVTKLGFRTDKGRKVHYEFTTYSGTKIKGSYGPARGKDVVPVGSPIVVLYERDNPKVNTRYPPSLVKLDY
jgi:hypothetical protein